MDDPVCPYCREAPSRVNQPCCKCRSVHLQKKCKYCTRCTQILPFKEFSKAREKLFGRNNICIECDRKKRIDYVSSLDGFLTELLKTARKSSLERLENGRVTASEYTLTKDVILRKYHEQEGLCALTGIKMSHVPNTDWKISIERLDNDKGYTDENTVLIVHELNGFVQMTREKTRLLFTHHDENTSHPHMNVIHSQTKVIGGVDKKVSTMFSHSKHNNKRRNEKGNRGYLEHSITKEMLFDQLRKQQGRCYYSGKHMTFERGQPFNISLERLDTRIGYTQSNIVFICIELNTGDSRSVNPDATGSCGWSKDKYLCAREAYLNTNRLV